MPVSAADSWVALSSTVRNPVLAYMVATLRVSRGPVGTAFVTNQREKEEPEDAYVRRLIILDETTQRAFGGAHGPIEHVHVYLALLIFRLETTADFEPSALCQTYFPLI